MLPVLDYASYRQPRYRSRRWGLEQPGWADRFAAMDLAMLAIDMVFFARGWMGPARASSRQVDWIISDAYFAVFMLVLAASLASLLRDRLSAWIVLSVRAVGIMSLLVAAHLVVAARNEMEAYFWLFPSRTDWSTFISPRDTLEWLVTLWLTGLALCIQVLAAIHYFICRDPSAGLASRRG